MAAEIGRAGASEVVEWDENVDFAWGVKIPVRDGIQLNATVYKPIHERPVPALLQITPYVADSVYDKAIFFAQCGYAFVVVDCRGRGNSEGTFERGLDDGQDGHDVVEWIAEQPWCNGAVGMSGGSYCGYNQWLTLGEAPSHLKTIVPGAATYPGVNWPFRRNIFYAHRVKWLTLVSGKTANWNLHNDERFWIEKYRGLYLNHLPFNRLDQLAGNPLELFQRYLQHPAVDAFHDERAIRPEQFEEIDIPILSYTGYYDEVQPGALQYHRLHMQRGSAEAREKHYLIIGPWDHAGVSNAARTVGGLALGEAALLDLRNLHKEWYDWTLGDGSKPEFLKKRVAYYLMGAEEWKYADSLEAISDTTRRLYLDSKDGYANDVFHSGTLGEAPPSRSRSDQYVYDPLDVRPAELERDPIKDFITDQRYVLDLGGNGLVYHSAPFEEETEISGFVKFVAWIALDVPDTDFCVTLSEILPDGSHIRLAEDLMRARFRESARREKLITPGQIVRYEFDGFWFFSRRIARGSRLRLIVRCLNTIHFQKNYNSGGDVAEESGKDARVAHVVLFHDSEHPSFVDLPLVTRTES